nr:ubiquitin carboxyl-terminal hydrolase 10-like [Kogia breviceps]
MALRNPQYIFGDFSPDEFNQFFVTPRSSVELPPYGGAVLCGAQAAGELPDGQDCQRIEFGVNEVIEPNGALLRTPTYSISSTLNPQAPEFILSCTTSRKIPSDIDKEVNYSSADCQYPGSALALDGSSNVEAEVLENDGVSGGLGQRERKKKKKRPPGYYSYLKDGGEGGPSTEALVNGHAGPAVPNSVGTEDVDSMGDVPPVGTPRTWGSPQDTTDFVSDAVPAGSFPGALDSGARTAGQPEGCPGANLEPSHLPAEASRDTLLRTAVAQPAVGTDTTENLGVTNGQVLESLGEGTAANGVELHTVESSDSDPAKAESGPPRADTPASAAATAPAGQSQPAKSWASLFHDSKPSASCCCCYIALSVYSSPIKMKVPPLILIALVEPWYTSHRIPAAHEPESYDIDPTISEAYGHREKADSVEPPGEGQKVGLVVYQKVLESVSALRLVEDRNVPLRSLESSAISILAGGLRGFSVPEPPSQATASEALEVGLRLPDTRPLRTVDAQGNSTGVILVTTVVTALTSAKSTPCPGLAQVT